MGAKKSMDEEVRKNMRAEEKKEKKKTGKTKDGGWLLHEPEIAEGYFPPVKKK